MKKHNRVSSDKIESLENDEIFVFGSNESGFHGGGAAKAAMSWGAVWANPEGLQGQTYAIPTKNKGIEATLSLDEISEYVDEFINFAQFSPDYKFLVTEIGCGLAGLTPEQVAPLFSEAVKVENIFLPQRFWDVLNHVTRLSEERGNQVYDILVKMGGAREHERGSFLYHHCTAFEGCDEWRFEGHFSFGGKYRSKRNAIDYYNEDHTEERAELRDKINIALSKI